MSYQRNGALLGKKFTEYLFPTIINALFTLSFTASVIVAVIVTVAGTLLIDPITHALCSDGTLYEYVKHYALFTIYGSVFMIVVPYLVFIIRIDGMPKLSANILLVSNVVNLLMDLVYMGVFKMDTSGAALATVTGYVVGFVMELYYLLFFKKRTLKLIRLKKGRFPLFGRAVHRRHRLGNKYHFAVC